MSNRVAVAPAIAARSKPTFIEIAPNQILSTLTYNGQFPGPLMRFQEGREVTVDIFNDTDTPEQLHWHGQIVSTDRRWGCRGRHALRSCTWPATHQFHPLTQPGYVSIILTIELEPIYRPVNTAARSDRFTSSRKEIQAAMIGKSFLF